jgi:hypothetical protein
MEQNIKSAIFPALLEPAKAAAQSVLDGACTKCKVEGQEGFWVALQSASEGLEVAHTFEYKGEQFVIFEKMAD